MNCPEVTVAVYERGRLLAGAQGRVHAGPVLSAPGFVARKVATLSKSLFSS